MPQKNPFAVAPKPDSQLNWESTHAWANAVAQGLNNITGGNEERPGYIDVSPNSIQHLSEFYTGGVGQFASNVYSAGEQTIQGEDIPAYDIPFGSKVYGTVPERVNVTEFYDNHQEVTYTLNEYEAAQEKARDDSLPYEERRKARQKAIRLQREHRRELQLAEQGQEIRQKIREIDDRIEQLEQARFSESLKERREERLKERKREIVTDYNARVDEALGRD